MKAKKSKSIVGLRGILKGGWGVRDENEVDADAIGRCLHAKCNSKSNFFIASIQCRCLLLRNTVACVA